MITETYLELLKNEAANFLKVGSDRIKVELKQLYHSDSESENIKEVNGLFYIIDSFISNPDEATNSILIRHGNCANIHQFIPASQNQNILHSFKNVFCDHIEIESSMIDSYSPIVLYLSFEKF